VGRWSNKYVIGLTGNIAMGKSSVRKMLEHLGAYTIDADVLAHQAMSPGAPAYAPIVDTFGKWILDAERKIDRAKLAAVAFSHPDALNRLEAISHPVVRSAIDMLVSRAKQQIVVIEAIKIVDGPLGEQVDAIWVVDAAPQLQIERMVNKRGMTEAEARRRIESQNPQREKLARADTVITNNGALQDMWVQVEREWNKILAKLGLRESSDQVRRVQVTTPAQPQAPAPQSIPQSAPQPAPQQRPAVPSGQPGTMPAPTQPQAPMQPVLQPVQQPVQQPIQQPAPQPVAPAAQAPQPVAQPMAQPVAAPATTQQVDIDIRRGMPRTAEDIARLLSTLKGKQVSRMDVMTSFGERSYLLADIGGKVVGVAGFQVENLITRMDEFVLMPDVPQSAVTEALVSAVEDASKELQSEVGFMYIANNAPAGQGQGLTNLGYERMELETIKVPAWREAAAESQPPNTQISPRNSVRNGF
jgi:dephospho-CoA kinase